MRRFQIAGVTATALVLWTGTRWSNETTAMDDAEFERLHSLVKRHSGESRYW